MCADRARSPVASWCRSVECARSLASDAFRLHPALRPPPTLSRVPKTVVLPDDVPGRPFAGKLNQDSTIAEYSDLSPHQAAKMMSQIQAMRKQVVQLRQEANIQRITVSQACEDLIKFCVEHQKTDVLVTGINQSENPFKENKACVII